MKPDMKSSKTCSIASYTWSVSASAVITLGNGIPFIVTVILLKCEKSWLTGIRCFKSEGLLKFEVDW